MKKFIIFSVGFHILVGVTLYFSSSHRFKDDIIGLVSNFRNSVSTDLMKTSQQTKKKRKSRVAKKTKKIKKRSVKKRSRKIVRKKAVQKKPKIKEAVVAPKNIDLKEALKEVAKKDVPKKVDQLKNKLQDKLKDTKETPKVVVQQVAPKKDQLKKESIPLEEKFSFEESEKEIPKVEEVIVADSIEELPKVEEPTPVVLLNEPEQKISPEQKTLKETLEEKPQEDLLKKELIEEVVVVREEIPKVEEDVSREFLKEELKEELILQPKEVVVVREETPKVEEDVSREFLKEELKEELIPQPKEVVVVREETPKVEEPTPVVLLNEPEQKISPEQKTLKETLEEKPQEDPSKKELIEEVVVVREETPKVEEVIVADSTEELPKIEEPTSVVLLNEPEQKTPQKTPEIPSEAKVNNELKEELIPQPKEVVEIVALKEATSKDLVGKDLKEVLNKDQFLSNFEDIDIEKVKIVEDEKLDPSFVYPEQARQAKQEGTVIVMYFVKSDGSVEKVRLFQSSGHSALDDEALRVLAQQNYHAVSSGWYKRRVDFKLKNM